MEMENRSLFKKRLPLNQYLFFVLYNSGLRSKSPHQLLLLLHGILNKRRSHVRLILVFSFSHWYHSTSSLARVVSVSVGFSVCSRHWHLSLLGSAKTGASATNGRRGEREGRREKETLARKPIDFEKCPFATFRVWWSHSVTNNRSSDDTNLLSSKSKHAPQVQKLATGFVVISQLNL